MQRPAFVALALVLGSCHAGRPTASPSQSSSTSASDPFADDAFASSQSHSGTSHRTSAIATLGISPPDTAWASMSADDREMYMVGKVLPIMKELFARQDAARYGELQCETCHGAEMRETGFRMPMRAALPVPPVGSAAFARLERRLPEGVRFMRETVTPTMGTLLGVEAYTCGHCHPTGSPD